MVLYYNQSDSQISLEGISNENQQVCINGNMNQIAIGDVQCIIQVNGNGNTFNIVHSKLKINLQGNGNLFNTIQSHLKLRIRGNGNSFKQQIEIEPMQIYLCQGLGNQFPENVVNKSVSNDNPIYNPINNNLNANRRPQNIFSNNSSNFIQSSMNPYCQQSNQSQKMKLPTKPSKNIFQNNNSNKNSVNFSNSRNAVNGLTNQYQKIEKMQIQNDEAEKSNSYYANQRQQQNIFMQMQRQAQQQARQAQQEAQQKQQQRARQEQQQTYRRQQQRARREQQEMRRQHQQRRKQQQRMLEMQRVQRQQREQMQQEQRRNAERMRQQQRQNFSSNNNFMSLFSNGNERINFEFNMNVYRPEPEGFVRQVKPAQLPDHGLSESELQRLHSHYHTGQVQQCTICFMEIEPNDQETFLSCIHGFHTHCIQTWLKKSSKCPICNQNVRKNF